MLQFMRKFAKSWIFKIFAYLLIAAFALTGVSAGFMADFSDNYLVKVDGEKIYPHVIDQKYDRIVQNLRARGIDFSEEQLTAMGISKLEVLNNVIQEKLLRNAANDIGISISDEIIKEEIASSPNFQKDGKFNKEIFNMFIYQLGMRETSYIEELREELSVNVMRAVLLNDNIQNDQLNQQTLDKLAETRTVRLVTIPANKKKFDGEVKDEDLEEFYFENSFVFEVPEKRSASILKVTLHEGKEEETYEITANIEDEIAGGSTFAEIAKKLNVDLQNVEVDLNNIAGLPDIVVQNIFGGEVAEPSNIIEDGNNYYFVNINSVTEAYIPELEEVKASAIIAYKAEQNKAATREFANKIFNEIKDENDYRKTTRKNGLKTRKIENLSVADYAQVNFELLQDSFEAEKGEVFGVYENPDESYEIAILEEIGSKELAEIQVAEYQDNITKEYRAEILSQFLSHLRQEYPIEENPNYQKN